MDRETLNSQQGIPLDDEGADEAVHFVLCEGCGQAFDCRRLGDVLHHEQPEHQPVPINS